MVSLYTGRLLSGLLCHWLVGRAAGRGFPHEVPLAGGPFSLFAVDREGVSERVVKMLLAGSVC